MKIKLFLATAFLVAAPAIAADNGPAAPGNQVCLRHDEIDGWGARNDHSVIINDRFGKKYLVKLEGICNDLNFSFGMGIRPFGHVPAFGTCVERGDRIVMRGGGATRMDSNSCWVTGVQAYTKDMEKADRFAHDNHKPLPTF